MWKYPNNRMTLANAKNVLALGWGAVGRSPGRVVRENRFGG